MCHSLVRSVHAATNEGLENEVRRTVPLARFIYSNLAAFIFTFILISATMLHIYRIFSDFPAYNCSLIAGPYRLKANLSISYCRIGLLFFI